MRINVTALAQVLQHSPHHYLGITDTPLDPPHAPPCAMITERTMTAFQYALDRARDYWPHANQLLVVGANSLVHAQTPGQIAAGNVLRFPAGFEPLQQPTTLLDIDISTDPA